MKPITLIILIFIFYLYKNNEKENFSKLNSNKYLTLIFSDNKGKPSHNFKPNGYGGFSHNEIGYLLPLPKIANKLNRKAVFTPPWISLNRIHNNNNIVNKNNKWTKYLNVKKIKNLENDPPFIYNENGDIKTNLTIGYYRSDTPLNKIDNRYDIIALVNFNDKKSNLKIYSYLNYNNEGSYENNRYEVSSLLKNYANAIIKKLNLKKFVFIHVRRGDSLNSKYLCPPIGCKNCTKPDFIASFIKNNIKLKNIIISTNEKNSEYKKELLKLLKDYNIIFEDKLFYNNLPDDIFNDNYCKYLILHEIASKSSINVGTTNGYVRLGIKYDYTLNEYYNKLNKIM